MPEGYSLTVIDVGSEAFLELAGAIGDPYTYKISIEIRRDGIAVKKNEAMWSPTLSTSTEGKLND